MAVSVVEVVMPQMGVSVSEGTILRWLKQEGDTVAADEPLLEISTDKVDTEVPSPGSGIVQQILVAEGETVEVGTTARGDRAGRGCRRRGAAVRARARSGARGCTRARGCAPDAGCGRGTGCGQRWGG